MTAASRRTEIVRLQALLRYQRDEIRWLRSALAIRFEREQSAPLTSTALGQLLNESAVSVRRWASGGARAEESRRVRAKVIAMLIARGGERVAVESMSTEELVVCLRLKRRTT